MIDDDPETVSVFCEYLRAVDVKVAGFGYSGKDAVDLYEEHRPDLVFLDLVMPDYDGFYALERIKSMDPAANVAVITAGHHDAAVEKRLEALGPAKIVVKPFEVEQILDLVARFR